MRQGLGKIEAVLFDLDGTLIDTAPDMVAVLTVLQHSRGLEPLPYETARNNVSNGALGLIRAAFPRAQPAELDALHREYLDLYEDSVCIHSRIFPDLPDLLDDLDSRGCPWGVVTNKPTRMTEPLLAALGLASRLRCAISGDTLPQRKPDPAPLLLACRQIGSSPQATVYVGDAARDVEAGHAAGMLTVAAAYGYIVVGDDPAAWNPHAIAPSTKELAKLLLKAVNLEA